MLNYWILAESHLRLSGSVCSKDKLTCSQRLLLMRQRDTNPELRRKQKTDRFNFNVWAQLGITPHHTWIQMNVSWIYFLTCDQRYRNPTSPTTESLRSCSSTTRKSRWLKIVKYTTHTVTVLTSVVFYWQFCIQGKQSVPVQLSLSWEIMNLKPVTDFLNILDTLEQEK